MKSFFLFAFALLGNACAPGALPAELAPEGFTSDQLDILTDTVDHWCRAVGWCPDIMGSGSVDAAPIVAESGEAYARHGRGPRSAGFNNGETVRLNMGVIATDPDRTWETIAHELGHFGIEGHTGLGTLMAWAPCLERAADGKCARPDPAKFCIDATSAGRFCAEQGWPRSTCHSTCEIDRAENDLPGNPSPL